MTMIPPELWKNFLKKNTGPWPYLRLWLLLTISVETLMLIFNHRLPFFYSVISLLFAGGFFLRLVKVYPGRAEPLILDFSGALLASGFAFLAKELGESNARFLLIPTSSAIILPHIFYIFNTFGME